MLILTRKAGQSFRIGDDVVITITELAGDKVKIGIEAPKSMRVLREELVQTLHSNLEAASHPAMGALSALSASLKSAHKDSVESADGQKK